MHAKWFVEMFNHMAEKDGRKVCMKECEVAVLKELTSLLNLDPFIDINPITESDASSIVNEAIRTNSIFFLRKIFATRKTK